MIKPLEEYSPEDRAFVEFVRKIRSQPPKPWPDPGPLNWEEINAFLARLPRPVEDLGFPFGFRYENDAR